MDIYQRAGTKIFRKEEMKKDLQRQINYLGIAVWALTIGLSVFAIILIRLMRGI